MHVFLCYYGPLANHDGNSNENVTNKRFIEQNNGFARALSCLVHFFAVLCKTAK